MTHRDMPDQSGGGEGKPWDGPGSEYQHAIKLANRVLDRVNADPDDDLAVLARQFLRGIERLEATDNEHCRALAEMIIRCSLATGHGDTHADLLAELEPQIMRGQCAREDLHGASEAANSLMQKQADWRAEKADLLAALREMLVAHSMENIGVSASTRRIKAKERARAAIAKATGAA